MRRFSWPQSRAEATSLLPPDHPNAIRVINQILDHARAGRASFLKKNYVEAKFHRNNCALLIWRLAVDGVTANGEVRWDGAKYETRLPGRRSSAEARSIRDSLAFTKRSQSALQNHVVCDHIVPRNCVAETLIRPDWWDTSDEEAGRTFLLTHAEVAIISPGEEGRLDRANPALTSRMPSEWWEAPLAQKAELRFCRYTSEGINIVVTPWPQ